MKITRIVSTAAGLIGAGLLLAGCSAGSGSSELGEKYENSETLQGVTYRVSGSVGDGADDAVITIQPNDSDPVGEKQVNTILPWTKTSTGNEGMKVSMTVESLSSDGDIECQIFYQNMIIRNTASGDHATVTCEGELSTF